MLVICHKRDDDGMCAKFAYDYHAVEKSARNFKHKFYRAVGELNENWISIKCAVKETFPPLC